MNRYPIVNRSEAERIANRRLEVLLGNRVIVRRIRFCGNIGDYHECAEIDIEGAKTKIVILSKSYPPEIDCFNDEVLEDIARKWED